MTKASDWDLMAVPDSFLTGKGSEPDARQRLITAGLEIFGAYNLEGATTRQIALQAGVNQAAIAYYFGGKEGLYMAVIESVVSTIKANVLPAAISIKERDPANGFTPREALELAQGMIRAFLGTLVRFPMASSWSRIVMREQMQPTKGFDYIYENVIQHIHQAFARLLADATGSHSEDPQMILRAHSLVGQFIIFLAGRETVRRRMHWQCYTAEEARQIEAAVNANLEAIFLYETNTPGKGNDQ